MEKEKLFIFYILNWNVFSVMEIGIVNRLTSAIIANVWSGAQSGNLLFSVCMLGKWDFNLWAVLSASIIYFCIIVTKILERNNIREERFIWLTVSELFQSAFVLFTFGGAGIREYWLVPGIRFKGPFLLTHFCQPGPTF